jgi:HK97 family phage major capsid protein
MLVTFLKDHPEAGWKAGGKGEIKDDVIARAYIAGGYVEEFKEEAGGDLVASSAKIVTEGLEEVKRSFASAIKDVQAGFTRGFQTAGKTPFAPRFTNVDIDNGESEDDKYVRRGEFKNLGHFARSLTKVGKTPGLIEDDSLIGRFNKTVRKVEIARAVSTPDGMAENPDPDGGALVPPDFTTQIWERVYYQESLLNRTQGYTVSGNTMRIPANAETSRVDGQRWGGVLGFWEGEAQQLQATRPKFRDLQLRLKKLTVMTFVTNELLTDSATALEQYLGRVAPSEIEFKILDALINGDGAGIPVGILADPAFIQVAKDTSQATKTISYTNVMNVYNSMWAPARGRSIWVYNQEIEPQLWQMALPVGTGGVPVYLPPGVGGGVVTGGASSKPYGAAGTNSQGDGGYATLYGRPAIALEQCPGLGSPGDLMLIDWSQYVSIIKGSIQSAMSIHLKFDFDETVFRWIFRMDGQGAWSQPLTPYKTNLAKTYSFAVGIAQR